MSRQKAIRDFIQHAISSLSKEQFDVLVGIFQQSYWGYKEYVYVDGGGDGGNDIKVFNNHKEVKKCIQVTIQKNIEYKLKSDLNKVDKLISKYNYSNRFEFYCSISISESKIEEYKKYANLQHGIELDIFDSKRLSQLECKELENYIYSLHQDIVLKPEQANVDKTTKALYDFLANGKDTSDIKNNLVESIIISILYEKEVADIQSITNELEKRLCKKIPDIIHVINVLKTDRRIIKDDKNQDLLRLSTNEFENVKNILALSAKQEKEFTERLKNILCKHNVLHLYEEILHDLIALYKNNFRKDISDSYIDDESTKRKIFESLKNRINEFKSSDNDTQILIQEIKELCNDNPYLNKISASESFLSLYKSNQLEVYIKQKRKDVYFDTPAFVYYLCSLYGLTTNDWDDPKYKSMKSLIRLQNSYKDKITFYILSNYLLEVCGELQKALQIFKLEKCPFFKELGGTRNTFYNYYMYLKENDLFEYDEEINCFEDFIGLFGFEVLDPNSREFFSCTMRRLEEICEESEIIVIERTRYENFSEAKIQYEKIIGMHNKYRTETAVQNDVNLTLMLLNCKTEYDAYFCTWDTAIHLLRDKLRENSPTKLFYFYILNPARLSNIIALENFNINESALTNDIFAYADAKYDISNRVRSLLELIAPILNNRGRKNLKLISSLSKIRKEQLEQKGANMLQTIVEDESLPLEEVIISLIPTKEDREKDSSIMEKFTIFMSDENNADYIINLITSILNMKKVGEYNLEEFISKIKKIELAQ